MKFLVIFLVVFNLFANDFNQSNESNETNVSEIDVYHELELPEVTQEELNEDAVDMEDYSMDIAVILDKDKFFQFIPNILNSINAYMIKKGIDYHIKLYNKEKNLTKELNEVTNNYQYIFTFFTNGDDVQILSNYPDNYFFIPTLNKNQVAIKTEDNVFFGGINYKQQIIKLNQFITDYTIIIYEDNDLSKYITTVIDETLLQPHKIKKYPIKYNLAYNHTFVYLNTKAVNTAQILSNFTYNKIHTKSVLGTQIDYTPLIFSLTNPPDVKNLIIANSIFNITPLIDDNNLNLGSNINFNWLDFTTSTLLNVAYNLETGEDKSFLNDFNLYMFFNQIDYQTNLYKIYQNGFIKIEN